MSLLDDPDLDSTNALHKVSFDALISAVKTRFEKKPTGNFLMAIQTLDKETTDAERMNTRAAKQKRLQQTSQSKRRLQSSAASSEKGKSPSRASQSSRPLRTRPEESSRARQPQREQELTAFQQRVRQKRGQSSAASSEKGKTSSSAPQRSNPRQEPSAFPQRFAQRGQPATSLKKGKSPSRASQSSIPLRTRPEESSRARQPQREQELTAFQQRVRQKRGQSSAASSEKGKASISASQRPTSRRSGNGEGSSSMTNEQREQAEIELAVRKSLQNQQSQRQLHGQRTARSEKGKASISASQRQSRQEPTKSQQHLVPRGQSAKRSEKHKTPGRASKRSKRSVVSAQSSQSKKQVTVPHLKGNVKYPPRLYKQEDMKRIHHVMAQDDNLPIVCKSWNVNKRGRVQNWHWVPEAQVWKKDKIFLFQEIPWDKKEQWFKSRGKLEFHTVEDTDVGWAQQRIEHKDGKTSVVAVVTKTVGLSAPKDKPATINPTDHGDMVLWGKEFDYKGIFVPSYWESALDTAKGQNALGVRSTPWVLLQHSDTDHHIAVLSVHANNKYPKRKELIQSLVNDADFLRERRYSVVFGGDFNQTPRHMHRGDFGEEVNDDSLLLEPYKSNHLHEVEDFVPDPTKDYWYTNFNPDPYNNFKDRLDYIWTSKNVEKEKEEIHGVGGPLGNQRIDTSLSQHGYDHAPVIQRLLFTNEDEF